MPRRSKRSSSKPVRQPKKSALGELRIIAGQWRGRRVPVATVPGLRPTGDRVRETLFNWLQMQAPGSHCLDLFAGTGALGLEAASRGAASVTFVEPNEVAARQIEASLALLSADASLILKRMAAAEFLELNQQAFDIVFVDPPFAENLQFETLAQLLSGHLAAGALIYVEAPKKNDLLSQLEQSAFAQSVELSKQKTFGDVMVFLFTFSQ